MCPISFFQSKFSSSQKRYLYLRWWTQSLSLYPSAVSAYTLLIFMTSILPCGPFHLIYKSVSLFSLLLLGSLMVNIAISRWHTWESIPASAACANNRRWFERSFVWEQIFCSFERVFPQLYCTVPTIWPERKDTALLHSLNWLAEYGYCDSSLI